MAKRSCLRWRYSEAEPEALGRGDGIVEPDGISKMDDAAPRRVRDGIGAADGVELVEKRADVELGSMNRYAEPPGDGLVRGSFG